MEKREGKRRSGRRRRKKRLEREKEKESEIFGQQVHKKVLNNTYHRGTTNQNHMIISPHTY